ncbi:MAG: RHS repeat-associated core domain-containing protein, partial [Planctomycetota bacterium]
TTYTYDPLNRLITKTDALGCVTTYGYDSAGNMTSIKDANDHTRTYTYDELNRVTKITSHMGYETKYRYDGVGNIVEKTDPNDDTTSYQYDGLERRVLISYPDSNTVAYEYDENGNVTKLTNTGGIGDITYKSYDGLDRLASVITDYGVLFTKTIKYTYDGVGNRITMDADANVTSYEYDALNRLVKITDPVGNATTYEYDEIGRRTKMTRQNGIKTTFSYNKVGNLLNLTNRLSYGVLISSYDYTYDPVGNRLTMTDTYPASSFTTWYQYDKVYRLGLCGQQAD